ncbi:triose-phosphate isomerase [Candidatus Curculioniphilus buchneri]|uniref:triose-phosphate isomerase n=1 Tax=Candidatus Curculioniphilus buchneri TaxID=690594 RepID=UPI00376EFFA2
MRRPLVIGNWKLNGSKHMMYEFIVTLRNKLSSMIDCDVVIAPPATYLTLAMHYLGTSQISIGAQDVDLHLSGAFTGEISAKMLQDIGVQYVIIGHHERRTYHKENDECIAKKFSVLKELGLIPVLCIGETQVENERGQTKVVCANQIDAILNKLGVIAFSNAVIAYEPVWAIGTGKPAIPWQVQMIHKFIRSHIAQYSISISEQVIIQYGGSVNADNALELFKYSDIDGALVGSASLQAEIFSLIVKSAIEAKQK